MKKILLGTATLLATAGMAVAADMPVKAPILKAPPPVVMLWDNVYIGAEGGYGWSSQEWGQIYSSCFIGPPLPVGCAPILDRTTGAADV